MKKYKKNFIGRILIFQYLNIIILVFKSTISYKFVEINRFKIDEFWCDLGGCPETFEPYCTKNKPYLRR